MFSQSNPIQFRWSLSDRKIYAEAEVKEMDIFAENNATDPMKSRDKTFPFRERKS